MRVHYTERLLRSYAQAPHEVQKAFDKQVTLLLASLHHPSLKAKKYDKARDTWQARVNQKRRFYFIIEGDTYYILDLKPHPK